ncbi:MAG: amidohydrolase [Rubellimicrobium sp.]|nr:amidohydrolase [Rubellimicrobium sp.]
MRIIDTHLHLVYPDRFSYPWLAGAPAINRPWHVEDYAAEAAPLGIEAALHMEVDVAGADILPETGFMLGVHPLVHGAIAACRPENPGFEAFLDRIAALGPRVKGLRRVLHVVPDDLSATALFESNLRLLAPRGLTFDLCVRTDQAAIACRLADAAPEVQFVLDHCLVPDIAGGDIATWKAAIDEVARRPNVAVKISGVVAYSDPDWTTDTLRPWVEHTINTFGWDRVVWGSDHPVCTLTADLTRWVRAAQELVAGASGDEQAKLFHRNAERIYRIA